MATTNVSAAFPDLELAPGSTITVDTGSALATISQLNVYGISPSGQAVEIEVQVVPPLFAYGPPD